MKYIQIIFTIILFGNTCFAEINFDNPEQIQELQAKIQQAYPEENVTSQIDTLKEWQKEISDGKLNLSDKYLMNCHLPLIKILLEYNEVRSLDLSENKLKSFDSTGLTSLTGLDLSGNNFTSFDGTGFTSLTYLELCKNQLTSFDGKGLRKLIYLNLEGNQLTEFNGNRMNTLEQLALQSNKLTQFNDEGLTSLTDLNLSFNNFISFDGTGLNSLTSLNLSVNRLSSFDGTGLNSLTTLNLYCNQLTSFDGAGLLSLTILDLFSNKLTSFDASGLGDLQSLIFSWSPKADVAQLRIDCERDGLNDLVRQQMINALRESNNYAHQALGYDLAATYLGQHHGLARLSPEEFNVDIIKNLSTPLPNVAISDEAKGYWVDKLQGKSINRPLLREEMLEHIFAQALSDKPQDNGIWNLPANTCEPAAIILTAVYEHFKNKPDTEKESECICRLTNAFDYCQANQAPMIMQENELLGLSPLPDLSTVSGFINHHIIRFKQQCAGRVIEDEGISVVGGAHQYGRVTSILNGLFNIGCTLKGYYETFNRATEDEIARYSSCYVSHFTKESLIEYCEQEINRTKNCRLRARIMLGEYKYTQLTKQCSVRIKKRGLLIWRGKEYTDIDSLIKDMHGDKELSAELVESLLRKENILV